MHLLLALSRLLPAVLLPIAILQPAQAIASPAADNSVTVSQHYDKSAPGGDLVLWKEARGGAGPDPSLRGTDAWVCLSASDPRNGACATQPQWGYEWGKASRITLAFTERHSGATAVLTLNASSAFYADPALHCPPVSRSTPIHQAALLGCEDGLSVKYYNGKVLSVSIPSQQLALLPSGGHWDGMLILQQRAWSSAARIATWTATIHLDMTDRHNGAIYLPGLDPRAPRVNLELHATGQGGMVESSRVIETCLYDGYNANSPWLSITLSDTLPAVGRSAATFSLVHNGHNPASASERIDYRLALLYQGKRLPLLNGSPLLLNGTDSVPTRSMVLPGMTVPVACVPAPLLLSIPPFRPEQKNTGHYSGTLRIILAAEALAP